MRHHLFVLLAGLALAVTAFAQTPFQPDTVVVARGGVKVTLRDVDDYMQRVPVEKRAGMMDSPKRIEELLLNMLINEQLAQQAVQMKLDRDPEAQGKTGWARVEVLSRLRMQQFLKDLKLPDFEQLAHEEYLGHKEKYATHGAWTVQRIFVAPKKARDKEAEEAAWDRAAEARGKALADPGQFDALVAEYSDEPDKATTHGVVVDVFHSKPDKWLADAASSLQKPGDITEVLPAKGGYQFYKLVSKAPDVVPPFSAVHDRIVGQLKKDYIDEQQRTLFDDLAREKMDANPEAVASLRIRYDVPIPGPSGSSGPTQPAVVGAPGH